MVKRKRSWMRTFSNWQKGPQLPAKSLRLPVAQSPRPWTSAFYQARLPAKSPQLPAKGPRLPAKSRQLPAKSPRLPAKSPRLPAKRPRLPAKSPRLPAKSPRLPAKSPQLQVAESSRFTKIHTPSYQEIQQFLQFFSPLSHSCKS